MAATMPLASRCVPRQKIEIRAFRRSYHPFQQKCIPPRLVSSCTAMTWCRSLSPSCWRRGAPCNAPIVDNTTNFPFFYSPLLPKVRPIHTTPTEDPTNQKWKTNVTNPKSRGRKGTLPGVQRIILIRHGESLGNINERAYVTTADWRIPLTERGREQARLAGKEVALHLGCDCDDANGSKKKGKIFFYVSPYLRTRQTLREILREVDTECIVGVREDPRISEQQFGNFQSHCDIQDHKAQRTDFGRFYYRFPDGGESGFDVYNRVSGFIGTMQRDTSDFWEVFHKVHPEDENHGSSEAGVRSGVDDKDTEITNDAEDEMTICIVTHGLTMRLFLMRWFQYTVHEFERSYNPDNGRVVVLDLKEDEQVDGHNYFELSEVDRMAMGFPLYQEQERFRLLDDYSLLDRNEW